MIAATTQERYPLEPQTQTVVDSIDLTALRLAAEYSIQRALSALRDGNSDMHAVVRLLDTSIESVMVLEWVKISQQKSVTVCTEESAS